MNIRLKKEFQALFWPWLVAAGIGLLPLFNWLLLSAGLTHSNKFVYFLANSAYMIGVAVLAALPFGNEFQERTLSMLLSQPCSRKQIWREKMFAPAILILLLTLVHAAGYLPSIYHTELAQQLRPALAFVVFLFCSGTYWTLFSRSIIGGVALSLYSLAVLYLLAYAFTQKAYYTTGTTSLHAATENFLIISSLLLAPLFFWLSWRKFSRMDIPGNGDSEAGHSMTSSLGKYGFSALRSQTASPITNLVRKEFHLLRPAYIMMGLFAALWLLAAFMAWLIPAKQGLLTNIVDGFCAIYAPLLLLIAGSLSLGEEKNLGIHTTNLSSPISIRTQWLVKNAIASFTGLLGTVVLLAVMTQLVGSRIPLTPAKMFTESASFIAASCILMVLLVQVCFWAAAVTNRTTHAAILAALAVIGFAATFNIGMWLGTHAGWLAQTPVFYLMAHNQWSTWALFRTVEIVSLWSLFIGLALVMVPSWTYFRRLQHEPKDQLLSLRLPLITLLVLGTLTGAVQNRLYNFRDSSLYLETKSALLSLQADTYLPGKKREYSLSYADLAATGKLSAQTRTWLRDCTFKVNYMSSRSFILVDIHFPQSNDTDSIFLKPKPAEGTSPATN